jgi:hypothetical protein
MTDGDPGNDETTSAAIVKALLEQLRRQVHFVPRACQALTSYLMQEGGATAAKLEREWRRVARSQTEGRSFEADLLTKRCVLEVVRMVLAPRPRAPRPRHRPPGPG